MPGKRERILVAVGIWPMPNMPPGFPAVRQRDANACHVARQLVARKARLVVVFDRKRNGVGKAVVLSVIAPMMPAVRGIRRPCRSAGRLGQQRGLIGLTGEFFAAKLLADRAGDSLHAFNAITCVPSLVVGTPPCPACTRASSGFFLS